MKTTLTDDEVCDLDLEDIIEDMGQGCYNPLEVLASLRHQAHVGRLNNTEKVNECLSELGINIEIEDVEDIHNIVNPILLAIETYWHVDDIASHGLAAMRAFG